MDIKKLIIDNFSKTFSVKFKNVNFSPTYWQAVAIVVLIFLLFLTFARIRYLYLHWSMGKNATAFLVWGFFLAVVLEGFLVIGGRTIFTEILGWKNPPKPVATALDFSKEKAAGILGISEEIPESQASESPTNQSVINDYESLPEQEKEAVKESICTP